MPARRHRKILQSGGKAFNRTIDSATEALKRSKAIHASIQETRKKRRNQWIGRITASLELWSNHVESYRRQQKQKTSSTSSSSSAGDGRSQAGVARAEQGECHHADRGSQCGAHQRPRRGAAESQIGENTPSSSQHSWVDHPARGDPGGFLRREKEGAATGIQNLVKCGSALVCLRNTEHVPVKHVSWIDGVVEAYESPREWTIHAASKPMIQHGSPHPTQHSVCDENDFVSPWQAEWRALMLQHELAMDEFEDAR